MKLLYCKRCGDVVQLQLVGRTCTCGDSRGKYIDIVNVQISGPCLVLGFTNEDFTAAVRHPRLKEGGMGVEFLAFVIPESAISVERVDDK